MKDDGTFYRFQVGAGSSFWRTFSAYHHFFSLEMHLE
jgi:hypothetical protein